jgi:L-fuculose-phosphate aldolase
MLVDGLDDIWGHVTVRLPDGSGFLLKHLRIPARGIDPDEVMAFDYDGRPLRGRQEPPWEIPLYTSVFRHRPDVQSVVHVHPPVATALATAGATIHAVSHEGLEFGAGLPVFAGDIIDTQCLGEGVAQALGDAVGCMLKGHGAVLVGASVRHATVSALYLERTAKQIVWASSVGRPEVLPGRIASHIADRRAGAEPLLWRYLEWKSEQD